MTGDLNSWPRLYRSGDLLVTGILNGAVGLFGMTENLFDPPLALAPSNYQKNPGWGEFFIEPGLSAKFKLNAAASVYGSFSYVESGTRGTDNTGAGNIYYGNRELLFGGVRWRDPGSGLALDASYASRTSPWATRCRLGEAQAMTRHSMARINSARAMRGRTREYSRRRGRTSTCRPSI
jgi:hypothetical protein